MRTICALLLVMLAPMLAAKESVVGMSEKVFKALDEVQLLLDEEQYEQAREALNKLRERKLTTYELAHTLNITGYTWYQQDQMDRALATYREALALEDLPLSMQVTLRLTLGQINLVVENYSEAEEHLRALLAIQDQDLPSNKVLLAASLIGQDRHADALEPVLDAIETEQASGNTPRENWLAMLSSIYYELDDYPKMREVVEQLVILYPREQYMMNLAALHGQLGDSARQLALVESLLDDGRLEQQTSLKMIASLYMGEELPYKAAVLLEREIEAGRIESDVRNLELLSQAWYMSAETKKAIAPLREAAKLSESGELYLRLARLHMDAYEWAEAGEAAKAAIEKGGLRQEGHAWLLRGMAEVRLKQFTEASRRFRKAADYKYTEQYAKQWLTYVSNEQARVEATGG